ncbi:hypothetical protein [Microvirga sp. VF16]|uniref:hypothetical protein n=1 Tax=Microvirga sp. VF16 TaxID=2807101 RepID=UPI001FEE31FE|nr:hypothetical protein [Microvirga sp. VF16]
MERFNGRVQREVLGITIYSHRDLEKLLKGFNQAYNRRRQRVLKGASPEQVVQRRLAAGPKLANLRFKPPDPHALPQAFHVVAHAKEVSHPDKPKHQKAMPLEAITLRAARIIPMRMAKASGSPFTPQRQHSGGNNPPFEIKESAHTGLTGQPLSASVSHAGLSLDVRTQGHTPMLWRAIALSTLASTRQMILHTELQGQTPRYARLACGQ